MSLFPAYSDPKGVAPIDDSNDKGTASNIASFSSFPENAAHQVQKLEKRRERKRRKEEIKKHEASNLYYEDTGPKAPTQPSVPQITLTKPVYNSAPPPKKAKKKKKKKLKGEQRYFDSSKNLDDEQQATLSTEEFTKRTQELNQLLREDDKNIEKWLEYVNLQDLGEGHKRAKIEKKISIVDRAIQANDENERLLEEKLFLMEKIYTYDKIYLEAKLILCKHPTLKIGWKWVVSSILFNLSKMTAPGVLEAYAAVLQSVHRQPSNSIIEVIYECGTFLRQAGLWEQLFTLIQIYLEMSFTSAGSGAFKLNIVIPEQEIRALEDKVITSGLTLTELWLRIEHIRSGVNFLPLASDTNASEDPQRLVLPEDLSHLLYPLGKESRSRLAIVTLLLLKVPLLPCTETFYNYMGLQNVLWSLESPEMLFSPVVSPFGLIQSRGCLETLKELTINPQYLVNKTGDVQFLESVDTMFENILKYSDEDLMPVLVMQLRWWRLVVKVKNMNGKPYKSKAKKLLKQYRDFLPLYTEYALLEEIDDFKSARKVLETAIELNDSPQNLGTTDKQHLCVIYRVLVEMMLRNDFESNKEKAMRILVALSFGEKVKTVTEISKELVSKSLVKFSHVTTELIASFAQDESEDDLSFNDFISEPYIVSWIASHVWLSYIFSGRTSSAKIILDKALQTLKAETSKKRHILEGIYEIYIDLLHHSYSKDVSEYPNLVEILTTAINHFPNNAKFLHILASIKISGIKWKKISSMLISTGSCFSALYSFLILHSLNETEDVKNSMSKQAMYNQVKSHLVKLVETKSFERCPILWRLLLQCSSPLPPSDLKRVYYNALEKCPWVKILYYEAGKLLPQDLPEIQDLLVEKELRLHITPEELEILRESDPPKSEEQALS